MAKDKEGYDRKAVDAAFRDGLSHDVKSLGKIAEKIEEGYDSEKILAVDPTPRLPGRSLGLKPDDG